MKKIYQRFAVFVIEEFYPMGGTSDIVESFDNIEDAISFAESLGYHDCIEILDFDKRQIVWDKAAKRKRTKRLNMSETQTDFKPGSPVEYTGSIPVCPFCKGPTSRTGGAAYVTAMYFQPVYDEQGNNINPDRNTFSKDWLCFSCERIYMTSGNPIGGFVYAYNQ